MNPLLTEIVGGFLRFALAGVSTWMVSNGIATDGQITLLLAGLATGIATLAWTVYSKYGAQLLQRLALASPPNTTPADVVAMKSAGVTTTKPSPNGAPQLIVPIAAATAQGVPASVARMASFNRDPKGGDQ